MERPQLSESEIVDLALQWSRGDKDAFSKLYDFYVENLYRFVYFKVNSDEAEDITELVFLKAWEARKRYNPKKSSFSSWLYTIARNTIIDHYRVYKKTEQLDVTHQATDKYANPKLMAEESLTSDKLRAAIDKLPDNFRDILLLRFIDDMEYAEIADVIGKSEGSIRIMQFRAIKELRGMLEEMGFNE